MPKSFDWCDYELRGPPSVSLDDYTFHSFGCEQLLKMYLERIREIRENNESIRWMLMDFWGRGKSTLMYNLCSKINDELFFSSHEPKVLAIFVNHPQKAEDLLDYSCENGLPYPWKPTTSKENCATIRKQLFTKALRALAFAWACRASQENKSPSSPCPTSEDLQVLFETDQLNEASEAIIERFDSPLKDRYAAAARLLAEFLEQSFSKADNIFQDFILNQTLKYFPGLLYPENSSQFLLSYSNLLREPQKGLRNFIFFHLLCEFANIHILLVIDEAAEWDKMVGSELDDFLLEMLPTNRLSAIIISRADVENSLRGQKRFRYFHLRAYTKQIYLQEPTQGDIMEIAKGILATNRSNAFLKLFPFDEAFIISLSHLTIRAGHFNNRMFVRGINSALRLSLNWERENVEICNEFINKTNLLDELAEDLKLEDRKGLQPLDFWEKTEEIKKKVEAARLTCKLLLSGIIVPPTRYMFDITKGVVSKYYRLPILSDIEVLAYSRKDDRPKVAKKIAELKIGQVSYRAESYLQEWILNKVKAELEKKVIDKNI